MRIRAQADFWSGILFAALGVAVVVLARNYRLGSAARMGPGYFPTLLGALMTLLGLTLLVPSMLRDGAQVPRLHLRTLSTILLGVAAFGLALDYLGLVAAVAALVLIGGLADPELTLLESAAVAALLVVFSVGVFWGLLGMPFNLWPNW